VQWKPLSLTDIAKLIGAAYAGHERTIRRLATLQQAEAEDISFLSNSKYSAQLRDTRAGVVICKPADAALVPGGCVALQVANPYHAYATLATHWQQLDQGTGQPRIHPMSYVAPSAKVAASARIDAFAYIGERVVIGERTVLHPRATVLEDCVVGDDCILHSGCVIGADGFGFAPSAEGWVKIPQLGAVHIGSRSDIGANTTIDRGALADTVLAEGVKLDDQVHVAHNVRIGRNTAIAGCVGIAGSAVIGDNCTIGGAAGILGHIELADNVHISAFSLVTKSIREPGVYTGIFPLDKNDQWEKNAAALRQLHKLRERLRGIEFGQTSGQKPNPSPEPDDGHS
jgi:UDP-3-O-[3-hydroxymyristoyl] glucosamine N-acyltransferase